MPKHPGSGHTTFHNMEVIPQAISFDGEDLTIQDHSHGAPDTTEIVLNDKPRVDNSKRVGG